ELPGRARAVRVAVVGLLLCSGVVSAQDRFAAKPGGGQQQPQPAVRPDPLLTLVNEAIRINESRYLDIDQHTPWQILHGILAYRNAYQLKSKAGKVSALEFVSN